MEDIVNEIPEIMVIDDMEINAKLLKGMVNRMGYVGVTAANLNEVIEQMNTHLPHLIMIDIYMPDTSGYEICKVLKDNPVTRDIPVIFVSAEDDLKSKKKAFELGVVDYVTKPLEYVDLLMRVNIHLKMYKMKKQLEYNNFQLNRVVQKQSERLEKEQKRMLRAIAMITEGSNIKGMSKHMDNVSYNSKMLAQALNFTEKYEDKISKMWVNSVEMAASFHDIGKIAIPREILNRPGPITEEEKILVKTHTTIGYEMLKEAYPHEKENGFMHIALEVVRSHHEQWDGRGYPDGLAMEDIPLSARVVAIVDYYDTMLGARVYKKPCSREYALNAMKNESEGRFDPYLLEVFFKIERQLKTKYE